MPGTTTGFCMELVEPRLFLSVAPLPGSHRLPHVPNPTAAQIKAALKEKVVEPVARPMRDGVTVDAGSPTALATGEYSASQLLQTYGIDQVQDDGGNGAGQTIAIIDAYNDPDAAADIATFDAAMGLPAPPHLWIVGQNGGAPPTINGNTEGTTLETSLDIEWAHAVAPQANILLVEANSLSYADLIQGAVGWAETQTTYPNVSTVSMSFGGPDAASLETSLNGYFLTPAGHTGITFIASSGDSGAYGPGGSTVEVNYPAASPNVLSVGGTTLYSDAASNVYSEVGWGYSDDSGFLGSGGGVSTTESEPTYQDGVVSSSGRAVPDVSFDADPGTGVAVCDSDDYGSADPWIGVGGTSLSAPCWAGLISIVDQQRVNNGLSTLDGATQTLPKIYNLSAGDFRDITSGNNGAYNAGPGYDFVTGRGSPIVDKLVNDLSGQATGADLTFSTPSGWSSPLVVTPTSGSRSDGSFVAGTTLLVDWNGVNAGTTATTNTFQSKLIVDGSTKETLTTPSPLAASATFGLSDFSIGPLTAGSHTITVQVDSNAGQSELNTANDIYTRVITVVPSTDADIQPYTPLGWSAPIVATSSFTGTTDTTLYSTDNIYLDIALANFGSTASAAFFVSLTLDGETLAPFSVQSLPGETYVSASGIELPSLPVGTYTIGLLCNNNQATAETNYLNDDYNKTITVIQGTDSISGTVFQDDNSDGTMDGSDVGLAGQTVYLDVNNDGTLDAGDISATTTAGGAFTISNVVTGTYFLSEVVPSGYVQTSPSTDSYYVSISTGQSVTGNNFGNFPISYAGTSGNDNYTVQLDSTGTNLQILVGGTPTYSAPASIVPSLSFSLGAGDDTLTISGANGNPIPSGGITYNGGAHVNGNTLEVLGSSGSDSLTANAGQVLFGSNPINYSNVQNLIIDPGAGSDTLAVNAGIVTLPAQTTGGGILERNFASLSVAAGATLVVGTNTGSHADRTLVVASSLNVASTARLDLGGNDMIAHNGSLGEITSLLASGYAGGTWNGDGIFSSAAADDSTMRTALGVLLNSNSLFTAFDGQTVVSSDVLVKYTYYGDANLDGVVNGSDYTMIDNGFNNGLSGWQNGDFNYDGSINGSDYTLIDNAFNTQGASL